MMRELTRSMGILTTQFKNMSQKLDGVVLSSSRVGAAQNDLAKELTATAKELKASTLTASGGLHSEDKTSREIFENALKFKQKKTGAGAGDADTNQGQKTPQQDSTEKNLQKAVGDAMKAMGMPEDGKSSDNHMSPKEQKDRMIALAEGQEFIAAQFNDNPYLRKIGDLQETLDNKKKEDRKSKIGESIAKVESWGSANNPLNKFISGIGKSMTSAKNAMGKVGDTGNFLFGGGLQARSAKIRIEKNRREANRQGKLVNAYASRQDELKELLKSGNLSQAERQQAQAELQSVSSRKANTEGKIKNLGTSMSADTFKVLSYLDKKTNKKEYNSFSGKERSLLDRQLRGNIEKSMIGSMGGAGKKSGGAGGLLEAINSGFAEGKKRNREVGKSGPIQGETLTSGKKTFGNTLTTAGRDGNKVLSATSGDAGSDLKQKRERMRGLQMPGLTHSDADKAELRKLQDEVYGPKAKARNKKFSDVLTAKGDTKGKGGNPLDAKLKTSGKPTTVIEAIGSMSENLGSIKGGIKGLGSGIGDKISNAVGGASIGTMMKVMAVAGAAGFLLHPNSRGAGAEQARLGGEASGLAGYGAKKGLTALGTKGGAALTEKMGGKLAGKAAGGALKMAGMGAGKMAGKMIPMASLAIGTALAASRARDGDYLGASMEMASGIAGMIPGVGTAISVGLSGMLMVRDYIKGVQAEAKAKEQTKLEAVDKKYEDKYGFKTADGSRNIALTASNLKANFSQKELMEMQAKFHAHAILESQASSMGTNIAKRNAEMQGQATGNEIIK